MSSDLNRTMIIGRLVRDPEFRAIANGSMMTNFSIANNKVFISNGEKKQQVSFFTCVAWGKLGELINQHCKKGDRVGVEGRLQQNSWQDADGNSKSTVQISAENVQFLSAKNSGASDNAEVEKDAPEIENNPFSDNDIPF